MSLAEGEQPAGHVSVFLYADLTRAGPLRDTGAAWDEKHEENCSIDADWMYNQ